MVQTEGLVAGVYQGELCSDYLSSRCSRQRPLFDVFPFDWHRQVAQCGSACFLNLLFGFKANCSVPERSVKLGHRDTCANEPAAFFQGLWVTGKRPSRYLKRTALRKVHTGYSLS